MKLGIYEPYGFSGSSYYRTFGPLSKIKDLNIVEIHGEITVNFLYTLDALLVSRPADMAHFKLIEMGKQLGLPVWVDMDDNLFDVPITNPAYKAYKGKLHILTQSLQMADVVSCSTPHLKKTIEEATEREDVVVIRNAVENTNFQRPRIGNPTNIVWRGSNTHAKDLEVWRGVFERLARDNRFLISFFGHIPVWDMKFNFYEFVELFEFKKRFSQVVDILIYPLEDIAFNKSKSNIAWLEATQAGAITYATPMSEEWRFKSILTNPLELLDMSTDEIHTHIEKGHKNAVSSIIDNKLTLEYTNEIRKDIINILL